MSLAHEHPNERTNSDFEECHRSHRNGPVPMKVKLLSKSEPVSYFPSLLFPFSPCDSHTHFHLEGLTRS